MTDDAVAPEPVTTLIARMEAEPLGLIALGIPRCPACRMLPASLTELRRARPDLPIGLALLQTPADWDTREELLWPRGIRVTRSCVPLIAVVRNGRAVEQRHGGAPAAVLDDWLTGILGPGERRVAAGPSGDEEALLADMAARRGQHGEVFERRQGPGAGPIRVL